jgi:branched-chain amino acid transport system substrate-binding protein
MTATRFVPLLAAAAITLAGAAAAQPKEIIVGAPNSLTGGFGEGGRQVIAGLEIAVDQINKEGGIKSLGGAKLKLISADTSSDQPSQAASVTRRMISQDKATVLVGAHTSTMTLSAQIEAERAEVPIITTSYADPIVTKGYKYTFKIPPQSSVLSIAGLDNVIELYKDLGKGELKKVAVFHGTDASAQASGKAYMEILKERKIDVVANGAFPSGMTDPTPVVGPVMAAKPQVLLFNGFTNDLILVARALRNLNVNIPIVGSGSGISVKSIPETLGPQANGIMGTLAWNWDLPTKGVKEFGVLYKAAYPSEPFPPQEAGEGYAIGMLIRSALEKAASDDPKKIRDAIAAIDEETILPGERVAFAENGLNKHIVPILVGWIDGSLRTLGPKQYRTATPLLP